MHMVNASRNKKEDIESQKWKGSIYLEMVTLFTYMGFKKMICEQAPVT